MGPSSRKNKRFHIRELAISVRAVLSRPLALLFLLAAAQICVACSEKPAPRPRRHRTERTVEAETEAPVRLPERPELSPPECGESVVRSLGALTAEEMCSRYADARCRAELDAECCLGAPRLYDEGILRRCKEELTRYCGEYVAGTAVREGRVRLDGVTAARRLRAYECRAFDCTEGLDLFEEHEDFLIGDGTLNSPCAEGIERLSCAAGLTCLFDYGRRGDEPQHSKCVRALGRGDRCSTRHDACRAGLFCEPTLKNEQGTPDLANALTFDLPGHCVSARENGEMCPATFDGGDHYCRSGICIEGTCAERSSKTMTYCRSVPTRGF